MCTLLGGALVIAIAGIPFFSMCLWTLQVRGQKTGSTRNAINLQLTESTSGLRKKQRRKPNADWIQESKSFVTCREKRRES
jgi:hypothetical protein